MPSCRGVAEEIHPGLRKMRVFILLFILLLLVSYVSLYAQEETLKTRVGVIPMINTEGDPQYDPICETVDDTVILNIELLNRYLILKTEKIDPYGSPGALKEYAEENRLDNLVFGKLALDRNKEIVLEMSVYDKLKNRITITKEGKAEDIFSIFDAANSLVKELVQEFSSIHMGYGAISLENVGEDGQFSVFIDGQLAGENKYDIPRVFNGKRLMEIHQNRMLGPEVIVSEELWVYEDRVTKSRFAIPYLLDKERAELQRLEAAIAQYEERKSDKERVQASFDELRRLLEDVSYCYRLADEREKYRQMEVMYSLRVNRWDMEDNFSQPKKELFDELLVIHDSRDEYLDPGAIRAKASENANFFYHVIGVNAAFDFSQGALKKGLEKYDMIADMSSYIPITDYHLFEEERKYIGSAVGKFLDRSFLMKTFTSSKVKKKLNRYFGYRLKAAKELFERFSHVSEKELVVLTNPSGMEVFADDEYMGRSPVRIKRLRGEYISVRAEDPWFLGEKVNVPLSEERNFLFLRSRVLERIDPHLAESSGQKSFRLSWEEIPEAVSYLVQVDRNEGDFTQPLFMEGGIKENSYLFKEVLEEGTGYRFRVQAVNKNKIRSVWSYGEEFENRVQWSLPTGGRVFATPTVGDDGTVYVGSDDRCLYAIDQGGSILWVFPTGGCISSAPTLGPDGTLYFGSNDRCIYALSPAGELLWCFPTGGLVQASPVLGSDGTLYAGSTDGCLYALRSDGSCKWVFQTGGRILASPSVGKREDVFIGSEDHSLYALNLDGTLKWIFNSGAAVMTSPAVNREGALFFGSDDHILYALDPHGAVRWVFPTGGKIRSSPVLGEDESIYFGSDDHCLYALNSDGSLRWIFASQGGIRSSPHVDAEGTVYFTDCDKNVYALFSDGELKWRYAMRRPVTSSPSQDDLGEILIGSRDKRLYVLSSELY